MSSNSNNENLRNGDVGPSNNASLLFSSYEGEESFVVLERSTANGMGLNGEISPLVQSFQTSQIDCSFPVFNNHLTNGVTSSQITSHSQATTAEAVDTSNITSVSAEEIDKRLQEVLHENIVLKENIRQTNLVMKQQLSTVSLLQDRALEAQKKQQFKFEETKALILKLGSEKNELAESNEALNKELNKLKEEIKELNKTAFAFKEETAKLVSENASLKNQLTALQETLKTSAESNKKISLQPTVKEAELHALVEQLTRKLEAVERSRRQQEFDIERLQAQLGRVNTEFTETQRKLAHTENALQAAQMQPKPDQPHVPIQYGEKMMKYDTLLKQLKANIQEEQTKCNSLMSFLTTTDPAVNSTQFEISELRRLLAEEQAQSISRKENLYQAAAMIHEMLADFQKLGEELECLKADHVVKESHSHAYEELKKKSYSEKLDEVTAQLVQKEEALAISERHLASLQEAVRLQNAEKKDDGATTALKEQIQNLSRQNSLNEENLQAAKETVSVLEEQAKIYQVDFEAERKSRELLAAEKERILEDLRHLQRRNQELLDELNRRPPRIESNQQIPRRTTPPHGHSPSPPPPRPEQMKVLCPISNCNRPFNSQDELNHHMFNCWSNQYTSTFSQPRKPNLKCTNYGCKMTFPSWDEYTLHFQLQHSERNTQQTRHESQPKLLCPFCKVSFTDGNEHGMHFSTCAWNQNRNQDVESATLETKLPCPNCSVYFEGEENLTRHVYKCWKISDV